MSFESSTRLRVRLLSPAARRAARERVLTVLEATGRPSTGRALDDLALAFASFDRAELWLALAVLHGELPAASELRRVRRIAELDGPWAALQRTLTVAATGGVYPSVRVVGSGTTLLDVTGLDSSNTETQGRAIARSLASEWVTAEGVLPVMWTANRKALRALTAEEAAELGYPAPSVSASEILVPHDAAYVLVGTVDKPRSSEGLIALGQSSRNATASIGFGLGRLIGAEAYRRQEGEERFSWHVAAQRSFNTLVVVGDGIMEHYRGWERMLPAVGFEGPKLVDIPVTPAADGVMSLDDWRAISHSVGSAIGIYVGQ